MIAHDPQNRPEDIDAILNSDWMNEYNNLNPEEQTILEQEAKNKLEEIYKRIRNQNKEIIIANSIKNNNYITKSVSDEKGKNLELNLKAAADWPPTYAEVSKGGNGLHLHYIYDGDVTKLSNIYSEHIEVKIFNGGSALRRRLSLCNESFSSDKS